MARAFELDVNRFAEEATYEDVQKLLHRICHKFQSAYGGNYDDLFSEAQYAYIVAYRGYDSDVGEFTTFLWHQVFGYLMKWRTARLREQAIQKRAAERAAKPTAPRFDPEDLLDNLSAQAQFVFKLALNLPEEVVQKAQSRSDEVAGRRGHGRKQEVEPYGHLLKRALREYLRGLGWNYPKIRSAFNEVKALL